MMTILYLAFIYPLAIRLLSVTYPFAILSFIYPFSVFRKKNALDE